MLDTTRQLRRAELERRVALLPTELQGWEARIRTKIDMNAHFSQMNAIRTLLGVGLQKQQDLLANLDSTSPEFETTSYQLASTIVKTQTVWGFFRDKLELRLADDFKDALQVADAAAYDCYVPVMNKAVELGILQPATVREPPLTYLGGAAGMAPWTWVRGARLNTGTSYRQEVATLPIPLIEIPWEHLENLWELLSIHHEVGHDLESDLKIGGVALGPNSPLLKTLDSVLKDAGVPQQRRDQWARWQPEIFADLVGLQMAGPAFNATLLHILLLPPEQVFDFKTSEPHPVHYLRILFNCAYVREHLMGPKTPEGTPSLPVPKTVLDFVDEQEKTWTQRYGTPQESLVKYGVPALAEYVADFALVSRALMQTPLDALTAKDGKKYTVQELMPYTASDESLIQSAAAFLQTGLNRPTRIPPRHVLSAARVAVAQVSATPGGKPLKTTIDEINKQARRLVVDNIPAGLLGGGDSTPHQKFVASFWDQLPDLVG